MSSEEDRGLAELLLSLERQLMDPVFCKNREQVSVLLAEDFREFGSSGRVWPRAAILDLLETETPQSVPAVEDFVVERIGAETVLATYRAVRASAESGASQASLRSSIWVWRGNRWRVLFHQGTKIPDA